MRARRAAESGEHEGCRAVGPTRAVESDEVEGFGVVGAIEAVGPDEPKVAEQQGTYRP